MNVLLMCRCILNINGEHFYCLEGVFSSKSLYAFRVETEYTISCLELLTRNKPFFYVCNLSKNEFKVVKSVRCHDNIASEIYGSWF